MRAVRKQTTSSDAGTTEPATTTAPSASTEVPAVILEGSTASGSMRPTSPLVQTHGTTSPQAQTVITSEEPEMHTSSPSPALPPASPSNIEDAPALNITGSVPLQTEAEIQPNVAAQDTGNHVPDVPARKPKRARSESDCILSPACRTNMFEGPSITPEPDVTSGPRRPRNTALAAAKTIKAVANSGRRKQADTSE